MEENENLQHMICHIYGSVCVGKTQLIDSLYHKQQTKTIQIIDENSTYQIKFKEYQTISQILNNKNLQKKEEKKSYQILFIIFDISNNESFKEIEQDIIDKNEQIQQTLDLTVLIGNVTSPEYYVQEEELNTILDKYNYLKYLEFDFTKPMTAQYQISQILSENLLNTIQPFKYYDPQTNQQHENKNQQQQINPIQYSTRHNFSIQSSEFQSNYEQYCKQQQQICNASEKDFRSISNDQYSQYATFNKKLIKNDYTEQFQNENEERNENLRIEFEKNNQLNQKQDQSSFHFKQNNQSDSDDAITQYSDRQNITNQMLSQFNDQHQYTHRVINSNQSSVFQQSVNPHEQSKSFRGHQQSFDISLNQTPKRDKMLPKPDYIIQDDEDYDQLESTQKNNYNTNNNNKFSQKKQNFFEQTFQKEDFSFEKEESLSSNLQNVLQFNQNSLNKLQNLKEFELLTPELKKKTHPCQPSSPNTQQFNIYNKENYPIENYTPKIKTELKPNLNQTYSQKHQKKSEILNQSQKLSYQLSQLKKSSENFLKCEEKSQKKHIQKSPNSQFQPPTQFINQILKTHTPVKTQHFQVDLFEGIAEQTCEPKINYYQNQNQNQTKQIFKNSSSQNLNQKLNFSNIQITPKKNISKYTQNHNNNKNVINTLKESRNKVKSRSVSPIVNKSSCQIVNQGLAIINIQFRGQEHKFKLLKNDTSHSIVQKFLRKINTTVSKETLQKLNQIVQQQINKYTDNLEDFLQYVKIQYPNQYNTQIRQIIKNNPNFLLFDMHKNQDFNFQSLYQSYKNYESQKNIPYQETKYQAKQMDTPVENKKIIGKLNINIAQGQSEQLLIYDLDSSQQLATQFIQKHQLSQDCTPLIINQIEDIKNMYLTDNLKQHLHTNTNTKSKIQNQSISPFKNKQAHPNIQQQQRQKSQVSSHSQLPIRIGQIIVHKFEQNNNNIMQKNLVNLWFSIPQISKKQFKVNLMKKSEQQKSRVSIHNQKQINNIAINNKIDLQYTEEILNNINKVLDIL